MTYVLGTTDNLVRWYRFAFNEHTRPGDFTLLAELDLRLTPQFEDKETAKRAAQALGLRTWRYVRL